MMKQLKIMYKIDIKMIMCNYLYFIYSVISILFNIRKEN